MHHPAEPSPTGPTARAALRVAALDDQAPGTLAVAVPGLVAHRADEVLPLASVGKVLLLAEVARRIADGRLSGAEVVELADEDYCGGSGLLTGLSARRWPLGELALLTAAVSDNTATNALLRRVGVDAVNAGAAGAFGLRRTRVLDRIREPRRPEHAPTFAVGTAGELGTLAARLARADEDWSRILLGWLAANTDRAMVPALIPHEAEDDRLPDGLLAADSPVLWVADKTGTDAGIRTDVGVVVGSARRVGYAVLTSSAQGQEFAMVRAMRAVGEMVAEFASGAAAS